MENTIYLFLIPMTPILADPEVTTCNYRFKGVCDSLVILSELRAVDVSALGKS